MGSRKVTAHWLGRVRYGDALALQERLVEARVRGEVEDTLLLLEHEPVITLGRGAHLENVLASEEMRSALGVDYFETGRGGDVTYHAPGQLVAYPIFDLKPDRCDVRRYVRDLGRVMIAMARDHGIAAGMIEGDSKLVGVWVDRDAPDAWADPSRSEHAALRQDRRDRRAALALGHDARLRLHASTDLRGFQMIVPCGISALGVTSLAALGVEAPSVRDLALRATVHFAEAFEAEVTIAEAEQAPKADPRVA